MSDKVLKEIKFELIEHNGYDACYLCAVEKLCGENGDSIEELESLLGNGSCDGGYWRIKK